MTNRPGIPGRRNRIYIPPEVQNVSQWTLRGTQWPVRVRADPRVSMEITSQFGGIILIYRDKEAALSALERAYMEMALIERLYPDIDAEIERRSEQRRRGLTIEHGDPQYLNGGAPVLNQRPRMTARQFRQQRAAELSDEAVEQVGRKCGFELARDEIADVRSRAATVHPSEQLSIEMNDYEFGIRMTRIDEVAFQLLAEDELVGEGSVIEQRLITESRSIGLEM